MLVCEDSLRKKNQTVITGILLEVMMVMNMRQVCNIQHVGAELLAFAAR